MDTNDELARIAGDVEQAVADSPDREMLSVAGRSVADAAWRRLPQLRDAEVGAVLLVVTDVLLAEHGELFEPGATTPTGIAAILQAAGARLYRDGTRG